MTRTFWLSFGSRGCCAIDVTEAAAARMKPKLDADFPNHAEGAEWLAAAQTIAWAYGCNPGGQILFNEIPPDSPMPRNKLLVGAELARWAERNITH